MCCSFLINILFIISLSFRYLFFIFAVYDTLFPNIQEKSYENMYINKLCLVKPLSALFWTLLPHPFLHPRLKTLLTTGH